MTDPNLTEITMYSPLRDYHQHPEDYQQALTNVLKHGRFILGPEVKELELKLAQRINSKYCIAVGNGTDALMVALMALNVQPGDEVITVAHTWISTAEVISVLGAKPVFIDINPQTFLMDINNIKQAINPNTKGIIYVSLYGQFEYPDRLMKLAKEYNLWVIDDGAQSYGAKLFDTYSCNWANISTTSFFPSKPLGAYGDAGACFTNSDDYANSMLAIRNHGAMKRFSHNLIGLNARMDSFQGAILLVKLKTFDQALMRRNQIAEIYTQAFNDHPDLIVPYVVQGMNHTWAQYSLIVSDRIDRDQVVEKLKDHQIQVSVFYPKGLHQQECFHNLDSNLKNIELPNTDYVCNKILNIPLYPELTDEEVSRIINTLIKILND